MFSEPRKLDEKSEACFLSHIKTRYGYDFPLYFPHEFLMSFLKIILKKNTNVCYRELPVSLCWE